MKKCIICGIMCALLLLLSSCAPRTGYVGQDVELVNDQDRFIVVYRSGTGAHCYERILVDAETGVMYLSTIYYDGGGLTVMVDAEGNPLLYDFDNPNISK